MKSGIERIHMLDFLRGVAVVGMVAYHAAFDLTAFYNMKIPFGDTEIFEAIRTVFVLVFIVISGISINLSHNPIRNGLKILVIALDISFLTFFVMPELPIRFGILHFMGVAMLVTAFCKKFLIAIPRNIALLLFAILFLITNQIFPINVDSAYLYPVGLITNNFISADYYPLIPWIFAFFFGTYLTEPLLKHQAPQWVYNFKCPFVNFLGRHTLWVFLIHQPMLLGLFWLIFNVIP
ncbi:hypothetical protein A7X67_04295 [Clostridium sp. W14A]|nr:hypothetical protein A7X67_04295 [Clostridium sp. W14A]